MLHLRRAGWETKDIAHQPPVHEGAADQPALGLNDHHQIGGIGQVTIAPDGALQILGGAEFGHSGKIAEQGAGHAGRLSCDSVAVFR